MKERNRLRVATQTARRRQIGSSAVLPLLFTPSLSSFHAPFCSALGYLLFIFRFLTFFLFPLTSLPLCMKKKKKPGTSSLHCSATRALRIGNLALLKLACASSSLRSPSWFRALRCWTVAPESPASQRKLMLQRDAVDVCCRTD